MTLKRGLIRTAILAAIFVFAVGVVHKLLSGRMAGLVGDPSWLRGITGIFVAAGAVLAAVLLLSLIFSDLARRIFWWFLQGFKRPKA
jgi:hypothetical protein